MLHLLIGAMILAIIIRLLGDLLGTAIWLILMAVKWMAILLYWASAIAFLFTPDFGIGIVMAVIGVIFVINAKYEERRQIKNAKLAKIQKNIRRRMANRRIAVKNGAKKISAARFFG